MNSKWLRFNRTFIRLDKIALKLLKDIRLINRNFDSLAEFFR